MMQETSLDNLLSWALSHPIEAKRITTPKLNKYIPIIPTERQTLLLLLNHIPEIFYGGAAGGAKSFGLLAAALQYVEYAGYHALLLRRNFRDLSKPEALMDIARQWLTPTEAHQCTGPLRRVWKTYRRKVPEWGDLAEA